MWGYERCEACEDTRAQANRDVAYTKRAMNDAVKRLTSLVESREARIQLLEATMREVAAHLERNGGDEAARNILLTVAGSDAARTRKETKL